MPKVASVRNQAAQFFARRGNFHCSEAGFRQPSLSTEPDKDYLP